MNLARQAVRAWPRHELATRQQVNALRRGYIKARVILGDRWLLASSVPRKQNGCADVAVLIVCTLLGAFAGMLP